MDLIERVEVVRGAGSSLYGDNALFAVINVVTRRGGNFNGLEASGAAGSFDTYQGRVSYGKQFTSGLALVVSATVMDSRGDDVLHIADPDHTFIARRADETQSKSVFVSADYRGLTLQGGYVRRDKQIPNAPYGEIFPNSDHQPVDERAYAELKYDRSWGTGWHVLARGYYDHYDYASSYPYDYPPVTLNRDENVADWAGGEVQLSKRFGDWLTLTGGAEYRNDFHLRLQNFDVAPFASYQDTTIGRDSYALFFQGEWRVLPQLVLNAGGRYDHYQSFGNTAHPHVALIYNPWEQTTLKFLYGSAFRAPNAVENFYQDGYSSIASPDVKPEEVTTYELVAEQGIGRNLRASVSAFLTEAKDLIEGTSTIPYQYDNLATVEAKGIELELQGAWTNGLRGVVSYTFTDTEDKDTGLRLGNSPQHLAKLNLIVPVWHDQVFASAEVLYTSQRTTIAGNTVNDFVVANLTLYAHQFCGGWEASASLYNIFDTKYRDPASGLDSVQQDGRQFRVKVSYRF